MDVFLNNGFEQIRCMCELCCLGEKICKCFDFGFGYRNSILLECIEDLFDVITNESEDRVKLQQSICGIKIFNADKIAKEVEKKEGLGNRGKNADFVLPYCKRGKAEVEIYECKLNVKSRKSKEFNAEVLNSKMCNTKSFFSNSNVIVRGCFCVLVSDKYYEMEKNKLSRLASGTVRIKTMSLSVFLDNLKKMTTLKKCSLKKCWN